MRKTYVYIENMRMHAFHGVMPQERSVGNDYVLNVRVGCPWIEAAKTDDVSLTLNYATLAALVEDVMGKPVNLLETVAATIAEEIKHSFRNVSSIEIDIKKVAPPIGQHTGGCGVTYKEDVG